MSEETKAPEEAIINPPHDPVLEEVAPPMPVDHSVPYPSAPDVDHSDPTQEHHRGAKDPELAKKQ